MPTNATEFRGQFHDVLVISELRGAYPNVPIASDVDYEGLIAGDSDPVFITIPIGKANVTSGNGRYYDESWLQELERQTLTNKPIGLMGHMSEGERATAFKPEAIHWVGAIRDGDLLWGKGYVVGEARDRIRRYKAQGKAIATSIDAFAKGIYDEGLKAYRMLADSMRLNQIDIAPADRAGIPDLAAVPILTTEMAEQDETNEEQTPMDKLQIIRELTSEDATLLPPAVRDAVLSAVQPAPEIKLVTELREALGVDDKADLMKRITELKQEQETQRKATVTGRIKELVEHEETGIKVKEMRGLVTELVTARNPQTVQEADAAYAAVVESEHVKAVLASHVQNTMGPRQTTPLQTTNGKGKYFAIPTGEAK